MRGGFDEALSAQQRYKVLRCTWYFRAPRKLLKRQTRARGTCPNRPAHRISFIQEDKSTVRELENGWAACLRSLWRRLHATNPARGQPVESAYLVSTDSGRRHVEQKSERGSAAVVADCRAEPCSTQLGSADEALVKCLKRPQMAVEMDKTGEATLHPMGTGSIAAATIVRPEKVHFPRPVDDAELDASCLQAGRHGLPALSSHKKETQGGLWFDKALLRVGARVPWGRRHRGRFAKVKLLKSADHPYESFMHGMQCVLQNKKSLQTKHITPVFKYK